MNSSADPQGRKFRPWPTPLAGVLLAAAFIYVWIVPLFRPRGHYLWGYYQLTDLYLGLPLALVVMSVIVIKSSPPKYRRKVAVRLVSVLGAALVTVLIVDVTYALIVRGAGNPDFWLDQAHIDRAYNDADDELGFVRKPRISWRGYIKGADRFVDYRTDGNGFRNSSTEQAADVVFIGDSFTEASEVNDDDIFVHRVETATGLSVVNLGRSGYGPQQEFIVLQKYGLTYKPRFVVWQLFEGNDLLEAANYAAWKKNPQFSKVSLVDRYFEHSLVTRVLNKTSVAEDRGSAWFTMKYSDGSAARLPLNFYYDPSQPAKLPVAMAETNRVIGMGHQLSQSHGIQLLLIYIPTMIHVMEPYVTFEREEDQNRYLSGVANNGRQDFSVRVAELCAQVGCTFVDSFAALRQAAATDNRNLYIPRDEHLDVRGHEVIARLVTDWIRKNDTKRASSE